MITNVKIGEELICPVCGKTFKANEDTLYFIASGYTCNWQCFLQESKRRSAEKKTKIKEKNNGH